ncbi:MAG: AbrB family transcriptional regulator [Lysinibacillus sp.]
MNVPDCWAMLKALLVGGLGAIIFALLHIPMPWMLGAICAVLCVQLFTKIHLKWHHVFRNIGLVLAGYSIGFAFTMEAFSEIKQYIMPMIVLNIVFFFLFISISLLVMKRTGLDFSSALICCVPGGMSQILLFAEEEGNKNISIITFYHVLRVLLIVSFVPLIVTGVDQGESTPAASGHFSWWLICLIGICYVAGMFAQKIKMPTGYLLGPVFMLIGLNLSSYDVPQMPFELLHIAQLFIGIYIGLMLKKDSLHLSKRNIAYAFISSIILLGTTFVFTLIMQKVYMLDFRTSFLSIVPGGLDQMGIIATSVQADVTIVTAFQLMRVLFVSIFIVPFVKLYNTKKIAHHEK